MKFAKLIHDLDPSFITGFNDSSFDWPFIRDKLELFNCTNDFVKYS